MNVVALSGYVPMSGYREFHHVNADQVLRCYGLKQGINQLQGILPFRVTVDHPDYRRLYEVRNFLIL